MALTRLLVPAGALFWGLQFAFLNPALGLLLVSLYGAGPAEVGWVLAVYNASGFVASLALPWYADRKHDYLRPLLACGVLTLALAALLGATTSLGVAVIGLVVLGGPAGVGTTLLYAHLRHSGARPADVVNTRAIFSFAWVAGPPLATVIMSGFGNRAILAAIAVVAVLNVATTAATRRQVDVAVAPPSESAEPTSRTRTAVIVVAFVALQATNSAIVAVMGLFVTRALGLDVIWAGVALGVSAALEIPALLLLGRLRFSSLTLIASGCVAGIAYYLGMCAVSGPVMLIALQALNAWFFATVAGVGLTLFQEIIPRPGLASGLYANTRRVGAIISGPIIGLGSGALPGFRGVLLACAALTVGALAMIGLASRVKASWPEAPPGRERPASDAATSGRRPGPAARRNGRRTTRGRGFR